MREHVFNTAVASLIVAGAGACSSSHAAAPPPGTLPPGTAKVTINNTALPATTAVKCEQLGPLTIIEAGDPGAGATMQVSNATGLVIKSVRINDLAGFTGSSLEGIDGKTDVSMADKTYTLRGTADGFDNANPTTSTTDAFTIQVAC